jgi:hypothetical protein
MIIQLPEYELVSDRQSILPVKSARPVACSAVPQLAAPGWLSWRAHMVLWMELLMGAPHPASTVDLWVGAGVRERVLACFLAGWGDRWLSPPLFHRLFQLPLQHLSWLTVRDVAVVAKVWR